MSHKRAKQTRQERRKAEKSTRPLEDSPPATWNRVSDHWKPRFQAAVPLRLLSFYERGGITRRDVICAYLAMENVGVVSDRYARGAVDGDKGAKLFNQTARSIAVLSYLPDGVPLYQDQEPYDAESFLAGIIGDSAANTHVMEARKRAFGEVPISQEPLRELAALLLPQDTDSLPPRPTIGYLTEATRPPKPTDLIGALVAYLAIDQFCIWWKHHPYQVQPEQECTSAAHVLFSRISFGDLLSAQAAPISQSETDELISCLEILRNREEMVRYFLACYDKLREMATHSPGRIRVIQSFTQSHEPLRRAIFQHLIVLIMCEQLFVIERDIPESQDYLEVIDIVHYLLSVFDD